MATTPRRRVRNRILAVMTHSMRYAFKGTSRLAGDAGVSKSSISRLVRGLSQPSFVLVAAITRALEKDLGQRLDPRDLVSLDDTYPTPSVCRLVGCPGCLPEEAWDQDGQLKPEYRDIKPGTWSEAEPR